MLYLLSEKVAFSSATCGGSVRFRLYQILILLFFMVFSLGGKAAIPILFNGQTSPFHISERDDKIQIYGESSGDKDTQLLIDWERSCGMSDAFIQAFKQGLVGDMSVYNSERHLDDHLVLGSEARQSAHDIAEATKKMLGSIDKEKVTYNFAKLFPMGRPRSQFYSKEPRLINCFEGAIALAFNKTPLTKSGDDGKDLNKVVIKTILYPDARLDVSKSITKPGDNPEVPIAIIEYVYSAVGNVELKNINIMNPSLHKMESVWSYALDETESILKGSFAGHGGSHNYVQKSLSTNYGVEEYCVNDDWTLARKPQRDMWQRVAVDTAVALGTLSLAGGGATSTLAAALPVGVGSFLMQKGVWEQSLRVEAVKVIANYVLRDGFQRPQVNLPRFFMAEPKSVAQAIVRHRPVLFNPADSVGGLRRRSVRKTK